MTDSTDAVRCICTPDRCPPHCPCHAEIESQPASTVPLAPGLPLVKGHCPACGSASLFLGDGGYVTCSLVDCPEPDAASTLLEQQVGQVAGPGKLAVEGAAKPGENPDLATTVRAFADELYHAPRIVAACTVRERLLAMVNPMGEPPCDTGSDTTAQGSPHHTAPAAACGEECAEQHTYATRCALAGRTDVGTEWVRQADQPDQAALDALDEELTEADIDRAMAASIPARPLRVYVAGPYTADPDTCTRAAITAGNHLLDAGHAPLVPHAMHHWWHRVTPRRYEEWLRTDLAWVAVADAVLRLPGESPGADREAALARRLGIPVVASVDDLAALPAPAPAGLRQQYADAIRRWWDTDDGGAEAGRLGEALCREQSTLAQARDLLTARDDELERARARADAAETRLQLARDAIAKDGYFEWDEIGLDLAPRLTEWLSYHRDRADQTEHELVQARAKIAALEACYGQVAADALAHGGCRMRENGILQRAERAEAIAAQRETELEREGERLRAAVDRAERAEALVRDLYDDSPCQYDHHGGCQAHGYLSLEPGEKCPHADAKELLATLDAEQPDQPDTQGGAL